MEENLKGLGHCCAHYQPHLKVVEDGLRGFVDVLGEDPVDVIPREAPEKDRRLASELCQSGRDGVGLREEVQGCHCLDGLNEVLRGDVFLVEVGR